MTLLEVAVGLAVVGAIGAGIVTASAQSLDVPIIAAGDLRAMSQLRQGSTELADDVRYSQIFVPEAGVSYGTYESVDFAATQPEVESAQYLYDPASQGVQRELSVDGVQVDTVVVSNNVAQSQDLTMEEEGDLITASLTQTSETLRGERVTSSVFVQTTEAPSEEVTPPGAAPRQTPGALCLGAGVSIRGSNHSILGGLQASGPVVISGVDITVAGDLAAGGGLTMSGDGNLTESVQSGGSVACPLSIAPDLLQPFDFTFAGDTDLKRVRAVWQDFSRTRLRPGVYFVDGTLTLNGEDVTGQVTLIARKIVISGAQIRLGPARLATLALAVGAPDEDAVSINGRNLNLTGVIYTMQGNIAVGGSQINLDGVLTAPSGGIIVRGHSLRITLNRQLLDTAGGR